MATNNGNTNSNGGDAKIILQFSYQAAWQGQIEIPEISAANLGSKLAAIIKALESAGCRPAPITPAAPVANAGPPMCDSHGTPMKASKKPGAWFCPKKKPDGSYCPYTIGE